MLRQPLMLQQQYDIRQYYGIPSATSGDGGLVNFALARMHYGLL